MSAESRLNDSDLPTWIAHAYANLVAEQDPIAGYKRCAEFAEAFLAWSAVCLFVRASREEQVKWLSALRTKRGGMPGAVAFGDWVGIVRQLVTRSQFNADLQLDWRRVRTDRTDPLVAAITVLTDGSAVRASIEHLFESFISDRNDFAHRTADPSWCSRIYSLFLPAFHEVLRSTPGVMQLDFVFVREVHLTDDGPRANVVVLRGTARHRVEVLAVPDGLTGPSSWLFRQGSPIARIPDWLLMYESAADILRLFQGFADHDTAIYYATLPGAEVIYRPLTNGDGSSNLPLGHGLAPNQIEVAPWTRYRSASCDDPPRVDVYVGRKADLELLGRDEAPVIFITGMGGHGKSTLAARYLGEVEGHNTTFTAWDWRDCREEDRLIRGHLIDIIVRLTTARVPGVALADATMQQLLEVFFSELADKRWLFVFDNVDRYIDLETFRPTLELRPFIEAALRRRHNARFIFTCRPAVALGSPMSLSIPLGPFSIDDTVALFRARRLAMEDKELAAYAQRAHSLTDGHPLWLNVVSRRFQAAGVTDGVRLLDDISRGRARDLPDPMLESIWATLRQDEQKLLVRMAYARRALPVDLQHELSGSAFPTFSRFYRRFEGLKSVGLIVERRRGPSATFDLHPLIRTFVQRRFPKEERKQELAGIVVVFDRWIAKLRPLLGGRLEAYQLALWFDRIELELDRNELSTATGLLEDVFETAQRAGQTEEFCRVAGRLFEATEWTALIERGSASIHRLVEHAAETLALMDRFDEAEYVLDKYERAIPGRSAPFVNLCDARCYVHWIKGEFQLAIEWGQRGKDAKATAAGSDIPYSSEHNLALSQRDGGRVNEALAYFLRGHDVEELTVGPIDEETEASVYGNVGRCLWYLGRIREALGCYVRSLTLLLEEHDSESPSYTTALNLGYVHLWIGEALERQQEYGLAYCFFLRAAARWKDIAIRRYNEARIALSRLETLHQTEIRGIDDRSAEWRCVSWREMHRPPEGE